MKTNVKETFHGSDFPTIIDNELRILLTRFKDTLDKDNLSPNVLDVARKLDSKRHLYENLTADSEQGIVKQFKDVREQITLDYHIE